jgi:hypothetical protein
MNISKAELDGKIRSVFAEVYDSNGARAELPDLGDSTVLLETGLDCSSSDHLGQLAA